MLSIVPLVGRHAEAQSEVLEVMEMFHPSMSKALADERQATRLQAAERRRIAQVVSRRQVVPGTRRGR